MKRILSLLFVLALIGCNTPKEMLVNGAWARAAAQGDNGAVYLELKNYTGVDDELLSASTDIAEEAQFHESSVDANGVASMTRHETLVLASGDTFTFEPGHFHIMLLNLKQELKTGDTITLTLHFKTHADIVLNIPVQDAASMGGEGMDMGH